MGVLTSISSWVWPEARYVSVPSRGEWGFLPQSVVGYDLKPDMFPFPLEVNGGSYTTTFNDYFKEHPFPYPPEVTRISYYCGSREWIYGYCVSAPSQGNRGVLLVFVTLRRVGRLCFRPLARRMGVLQFDWIDENKERGAFPYPCKLAGVSCIGKRSVYV